MSASAPEAAVALRADLRELEATAKEAAALLERASWQLEELTGTALPMTGRTLQLARAKENIATARQRSEEVLEHLDASRKLQGVIQAGPQPHLEGFLAALERLEVAINFLQAHRSMASAHDALQHTSRLRDAGLEACSREFSSLLHKHAAVPQALLERLRAAAAGAASSMRASATTADFDGAALGAQLDLLPEGILGKLRALAVPLLRGASRSTVKAYSDARSGVLAGALEPFLAPFAGSGEDLARLSWQQLEGRIPGWVAALRLYVRLAQEEACLCAAIFPPSEQAAVLSQVAAGGAASLLESADLVLAVRRVPEKLFGVLDMHDAVEASLPLLRAALASGLARLNRASAAPGADSSPVVGQLGQLRDRLAAEVRACFGELRSSVTHDAARGAPPDGTVHPLCASTISLLRRIASYDSVLPVLFADAGSPASARGVGSLAAEARLLDRMGAAVSALLDALLSNLDTKAKLVYKSRALAALHLMNNVAFILHACEEGRELRAVGEGWAERHKGAVEEYRRQYMDLTWGPLMSQLRQDMRRPLPPNLGADKAGRQAIKDQWGAVNKALAEAQAQQSWAVSDPALRFAIKDELSEQLLPLYEAFCARYRHAPYTEHRAKYERSSPADLAALINNLFERAEGSGTPSAQTGPSPRSPSGGPSTLGRRLSGTMRRLTSSSTP